jgi:vacuolar protein sorting-associated protein 13A/C
LIFQIFGSIDILGNPWGLAKHIGMGIFDLIDKPIEGFTKGPIEGTLGIMEGGVSFLKNTTEGTCNSFEKSTRSIANMISVLSQDDEYQRLR